ncbi:hypothetical protein J437_LFUL010694 [Ladona fulva]|uniref:alkaline phosphatase n=1 Tax=Ladona fulva TaxID=123851 RepID=A0A8K0KB00_LADFU|nr:hypothetical protein J437_LFUL010694 [Ladona fulva]
MAEAVAVVSAATSETDTLMLVTADHSHTMTISGYSPPDACYGYPSTVPMTSETHGGEDVPVYAKGPRAFIFSGTYEQNYIMHATCYALGIGPASSWSIPKS